MRRTIAALLAAVALLCGCGGGGRGGEDAAAVLRDTSRNLAGVRSGDLTLRFVLRPAAAVADGAIGVELHGPFSLPTGGGLPVARIAYTQLAGDRRVTATFISTGRAAFVQVAGATYRLPDAQVASLRGAVRHGRGLERLRLDLRRWVTDPRVSDGPRVAGVETDRVSGRLNTVAAVTDLLRAAGRAKAAGALRAGDARLLARAVRRSSVEVLTGATDRLLRRLRVQADLDVTPELRARLGSARLHLGFELGVAHPNRPVRVTAPAGARPLPFTGG